MARMRRLLANLFHGWLSLHRRFPAKLLDEMMAAIAAGEQTHRGEVRFVVESRLAPMAVLDGLDAALRARQLFSALRVWDTEGNSGVLVYLLMAERRIEIVMDRGIAARTGQGEWDTLCAGMRARYARGQWREGSLEGIAAVHAVLARHFAAHGSGNPDELPDRPVLL